MAELRYPSLYQINTRVWLTELSQQLGRPATLDDIPDAELDRLAEMGFDWVWFLSVWQTGPAAQAISRANAEWRKDFQQTLPDLREEDIAGSGFAIQNYTVHRDLGGAAALARLRQRLQQRGLKLMLDFVPNHMAPDHPGSTSIRTTLSMAARADLARAPQNYCRVQTKNGPLVLAYGRDPYFDGLAGHAAAQLRQPGNAASDDRRAGEHRRAMRRRALRHGHAGLAGGVRTHLGHPG